MKTILQFIFAFIATTFLVTHVQAQSPEVEIVLTQNTDQILLTELGGIGCPGGDTQWYREYVLNEEGVTAPVALKGVQFGIQAIDGTVEMEFFAYEYYDFPNGFDITNPPTPIASGKVMVGPGKVGDFVLADFDAPVVVADTATIVVGVSHPTADGVGLFIAVTEEETKSSYYSSEKCGSTKPLKLTDMGLPEFRHLINLVVDTNLSVEDQRFDTFTLHPNPARDFLKLSLPPSEIQRIDLYDSSGKKLECSYHNNIVDVSTLMDGIYFLTINTAATVLTKRFIKQ